MQIGAEPGRDVAGRLAAAFGIAVEMAVAIFLVHLSLKFRHRQYQLRTLHDLVMGSTKPVIVAGDFNAFWGTHEIYLFMRASGLRSANELGLPSFPTKRPRVELDFVLVSGGIDVTGFRIPDVQFSDHRPLVCDFQIREPGAAPIIAAPQTIR